MDVCLASGGTWMNQALHFDDIFHALESLFVVATLEGWVSVMNTCLDITEAEHAPVTNSSPGAAVFFVLFTLLGGFFITNRQSTHRMPTHEPSRAVAI
jgi:hypothetical protein